MEGAEHSTILALNHPNVVVDQALEKKKEEEEEGECP